MSQTPTSFNDEDFKPKGATFFFILLLILGALIWFCIYNVQLDRAAY